MKNSQMQVPARKPWREEQREGDAEDTGREQSAGPAHLPKRLLSQSLGKSIITLTLQTRHKAESLGHLPRVLGSGRIRF